MENSMNPKEKIEAMKKYKRARFLYNLVLYSLTTLITLLFVSYPFWFPSTKHFFLVSLPDNLSGFFDANGFFVLGNIIVFILVGESRLATRSSNLSTSSVDVYDEYVERSKSFREVESETPGEDQREGGFVKGLKEEITRNEKVVRRKRRVEDVRNMPMDELNKRVEAFIKRVNSQRSLENY